MWFKVISVVVLIQCLIVVTKAIGNENTNSQKWYYVSSTHVRA